LITVFGFFASGCQASVGVVAGEGVLAAAFVRGAGVGERLDPAGACADPVMPAAHATAIAAAKRAESRDGLMTSSYGTAVSELSART
jgi:hypothetical protein